MAKRKKCEKSTTRLYKMHLELFIDLGFPGQRSQNAGDVASSAGKQKYSSLRIQMCCKVKCL